MNIGLQRKTDLAVRILRTIAASGRQVSGAELSASVGTTTSFLPQVVAPLVNKGWVGSVRGPGGGYYLTEAARDVSLFEVIEATEGPAVDGRCILSDGLCPGTEACPAHEVWTSARDVLIDGFRGVPAIPGQGGER